MQITTTFRDLPRNTSLQAAAERWISRLEQVHDQIAACHVVIERLPRHQMAGSLQIRISLSLSDERLVVTHQTSKDAYVALADAFRTARCRLLDHVAQQRQVVKAAPAAPGGVAVFFASKL